MNNNVFCIVYWDRIYGLLDGLEVGGSITVDGDDAAADGSDPLVVVPG